MRFAAITTCAFVALGAWLCFTPCADAGACASRNPRLLLLSPSERAVAPDAALIVGYGPWARPVLSDAPVPAASAPAITLRGTGRAALAAQTEQIAPGLFRVTPDAPLSPGTVHVSARGDVVDLRVDAAAASEALAAPRLARVRVRTLRTTGRMGEQTLRSLQMRISAPVPAGVVAVIVYAVEGETRTPFQWIIPPDTPGATLFFWDGPGRCETPVRGMRRAAAGETIAIAYVDANGHLSPLSATRQVPADAP